MKLKSLTLPVEIKDKIKSLEQAIVRIELERNGAEEEAKGLRERLDYIENNNHELRGILLASKVKCECIEKHITYCTCGAKEHNERIEMILKEEPNV